MSVLNVKSTYFNCLLSYLLKMSSKFRDEIVGKRFLSVSSDEKLDINAISKWEWRSGVVRAVSSRDPSSPDFTVSFFLKSGTSYCQSAYSDKQN